MAQEEQREENLTRGRELLERECKKLGADTKTVLSETNLQQLARKYGVSTADELIASVGSGRINALQVVQKLTGQEPGEKRKLPEVGKSAAGIPPGAWKSRVQIISWCALPSAAAPCRG